ncbi:MAG: hypothetical protein OXQ29_02515, partial [Rhodospirillaceae bacterium]|nr:hypothetical protein [Rhodospirillaceae bacterium]
ARRRVDGLKLRPRAGLRLREHAGHLAGAQVVLGGVDDQHLSHNSTLAIHADVGEIRRYWRAGMMGPPNVYRAARADSGQDFTRSAP